MPSARFSYHAFSRFAPYIAQALRQWPNAIVITPPGKPEGWAQPLRDAIKAGLRFGYEHPQVDPALLTQHGPALVVSFSTDGQSLILGPRQEKNKSLGKVVALARSTAHVYVDTLYIDMLARLVSAKAFTPLPMFVFSNLSPITVSHIENKHDVALIPVEGLEGCYQLI